MKTHLCFECRVGRLRREALERAIREIAVYVGVDLYLDRRERFTRTLFYGRVTGTQATVDRFEATLLNHALIKYVYD